MVLVHLWLKVRRSQPACDGESTCKLSSTQAKLSPAPIQHMLTPHDEPAHALQARTKEGHLVQGHPCDDFIEHSNSLQCRHLVEQHSMVLPKWSERVRYSAQMLQSTSLPQCERKMAQQVSNPGLLCQPLQGWSQCTWELCQKAFWNTLWQLLQTAGEAGARNRKTEADPCCKGHQKSSQISEMWGHELLSQFLSQGDHNTTHRDRPCRCPGSGYG